VRTYLAALVLFSLLANAVFAQSQARTNFAPMAPVVLVKPSGQQRPFYGGTDAARGAALAAAVSAAGPNDTIVLGSGTFAIGDQYLSLVDDGLTIAGCGYATHITTTGGMKLYADSLTLSNLRITSTGFGFVIGYNTIGPDFPSGHAANDFVLDGLWVTGQRDLLMFFPANTAANGLVRNSRFTISEPATDLTIDLHLAMPGSIAFENCTIHGNNDGTLLCAGSGAYYVRGGQIDGSGPDIVQDESAQVFVDPAVDFDTYDGNVVRRMWGGEPSVLGLGILSSTSQSNTRDWIGASSGVWPAATLPAASVAEPGIAELATAAEVLTGTDTSRAITPQAMAASGTRKFTMQVASLATNPTDNVTWYIGLGPYSLNPPGTATVPRVIVPMQSTLESVALYLYQTTPGSAETSTISIRKTNGGEETVLTNSVQNDANQNIIATGLNISCAAGEGLQVKWVTPAWATNPVWVSFCGTLVFRY
jgi:hypothetical protein